MIPVHLCRIITKDGIPLEGIAVFPKRKAKTAILWLHGLSSRFSSGMTLMKELSNQTAKNKIGYFKFNSRGHDIAARGKLSLVGGGFERFEDCVLDIRAQVRFIKKLGFDRIILAGHSTGANKALYYQSKTRDRAVKGIILIGPISDIVVDVLKKGSEKKRNQGLALARRLKKNPYALMPFPYGLLTARRYWSLFHPGEHEDTFPYYDPKGNWDALRRLRVPVAVIIGSRDEYLDRTPQNFIAAFQANARLTKRFSGVTIKGADHGFRKKEKELSASILKFIKKI